MNDPLVSDVTAALPELQRYALRLTRNPDDAQDLVQDCMVRALSKLHLFERGTNLDAWLTTILRNLFMNRCKAARRCAEVELDHETPVAAGQEHQVELREVGHAFNRLTAEQKFLVRRCGVEGRSYKAVAAQLGVSMGTIRSRLNRARSRLKELAAAPRRGPRPHALRTPDPARVAPARPAPQPAPALPKRPVRIAASALRRARPPACLRPAPPRSGPGECRRNAGAPAPQNRRPAQRFRRSGSGVSALRKQRAASVRPRHRSRSGAEEDDRARRGRAIAWSLPAPIDLLPIPPPR